MHAWGGGFKKGYDGVYLHTFSMKAGRELPLDEDLEKKTSIDPKIVRIT